MCVVLVIKVHGFRPKTKQIELRNYKAFYIHETTRYSIPTTLKQSWILLIFLTIPKEKQVYHVIPIVLDTIVDIILDLEIVGRIVI